MHRSMIALTLLLMAPLAGAQVYKWKDASGVVHYSQTPPVQGTQFKEVKPSTDTEATPAAAPVAAKTETAPPPTANTTVADTPENRAKLCTSLQTNLAALNGTGAVVVQQDGKQTALDDTQRKQQAAAAQTQYQQYCAK